MAPTLIFFLLAGVLLHKALAPTASRSATWGRGGTGVPLSRLSYAAWGVVFASVPPAVWWALTTDSIRPLGLVAAALVVVACCAVSDRRHSLRPPEGAAGSAPPERRSAWLALWLAVVVPLGFATRCYSGVLAPWVSGYAGGVLYVLFWILLIALVLPRVSPVAAAGFVLLVTSLIEASQLLSNPLLDAIRATSLGRIWIGSTFSWWDFPHYVLGAILGAWIVTRVSSRPRARD